VTAGFSLCFRVVVQAATPLAVRIPPSEFVRGDITGQQADCLLSAGC